MNRAWLLVYLLGLAAVAPATADVQPCLGEIRLVAFNFPPKGWAFCEGQLLSIGQNTALYSLIGNTFGGNGQSTFALPDLRGRVPVHSGQTAGQSLYPRGQVGGQSLHTLTLGELPAHTHALRVNSAPGTSSRPTGLLPARNAGAVPQYGANVNGSLAAGAIGISGGGQAHENRPPMLVLRYIIALNGQYPSHSPGLVIPGGGVIPLKPGAAGGQP